MRIVRFILPICQCKYVRIIIIFISKQIYALFSMELNSLPQTHTNCSSSKGEPSNGNSFHSVTLSLSKPNFTLFVGKSSPYTSDSCVFNRFSVINMSELLPIMPNSSAFFSILTVPTSVFCWLICCCLCAGCWMCNMCCCTGIICCCVTCVVCIGTSVGDCSCGFCGGVVTWCISDTCFTGMPASSNAFFFNVCRICDLWK